MMEQYQRIKDQHPDSLLFYRMGDFYELFFNDAVLASDALDIVLSKRGKKEGQNIPMCGVPVLSADKYLQTLIRKGFRVAVCEQTEDASEAKKRGARSVVARDVVRILTPGTLTEDSLLDARRHNFLAAIAQVREDIALAWSDISIGSIQVTCCTVENLHVQLARVTPNEILYSENIGSKIKDIVDGGEATSMPLAPMHFASNTAERRLCELYGVRELSAYGDFSRAELSALGAIISYLDVTQKRQHLNLRPPVQERINDTIQIDASTRQSLEISTTSSGHRGTSLLSVIDNTRTAAGGRLLQSRMNAPSTDLDTITQRQNELACFLAQPEWRQKVRKELQKLPDLNRSLSRLSLCRGGPRDLAALHHGLASAVTIRQLLMEMGQNDAKDHPSLVGDSGHFFALDSSRAKLSGFESVLETLERAIESEPPPFLRDGGFVREGYSEELDEERRLHDRGRSQIPKMQSEYITETGIASLKIRKNNVLGYFIEVPNTAAAKLMTEPLSKTYTHRQTVASAMRFTTEQLAAVESRLLNASSAALEIETKIFNDLSAMVLNQFEFISETAKGLAEIDVASSLAELAEKRDWQRPIIDHSSVLNIRGGRHPVVEESLKDDGAKAFVANDCHLAEIDKCPRIRLVTGPNMAGKSTYLRQNALIVILAQAGAFVPAEMAHIGMVSQIFSRVGASDELARGRSTFMVEMVETATILHQAGPGALVILDEIGRGTATYDGLSIAWATLEHLHEVNRCRALFATHYHELTQLTNRLSRMSNSTVSVREWENDIVFLYEVKDGAAERSYGVQVAKLAGMPDLAVARAQEILNSLETDEQQAAGKTAALMDDLPLFVAAQESVSQQTKKMTQSLQDRLDNINPDELSPRDALSILYDLKKLLREEH